MSTSPSQTPTAEERAVIEAHNQLLQAVGAFAHAFQRMGAAPGAAGQEHAHAESLALGQAAMEFVAASKLAKEDGQLIGFRPHRLDAAPPLPQDAASLLGPILASIAAISKAASEASMRSVPHDVARKLQGVARSAIDIKQRLPKVLARVLAPQGASVQLDTSGEDPIA